MSVGIWYYAKAELMTTKQEDDNIEVELSKSEINLEFKNPLHEVVIDAK